MTFSLRFLATFTLVLGTLFALGHAADATKQSAAEATKSADATKPLSQDKDYQLYKMLVDSIDEVERNYVTKVDRRELIEAAIRGVLQKLDPYSAYIGPEELHRFRTSIQSEFGGIGIQVTADDGQLRVLSPIYGTPAYKVGILAGDRILEIDGKSTAGLGLDEAIEKMKGSEGSTVTLTIAHAGKDAKEKYTLKREKIHIETVLGERRRTDGTWDFMLDPKQRIAYVRLVAFSRNTAAELQRVLQQLETEKIRGLILDVRFNPGGLLNAAIEVSDLFVAEGRIVSVTGRNSAERAWDAKNEGTLPSFPMVVLINRFSASASEIVAACLQDHKRATIIGERTWGKGSVQSVISMEDGKSALKLTTAAYRRPNGKNIHRFNEAKETDEWGVLPDQGFELRLGNKEMITLMQARRARDILQTPADHAAATRSATEQEPPLVDRQLQAALTHLTSETAKKP